MPAGPSDPRAQPPSAQMPKNRSPQPMNASAAAGARGKAVQRHPPGQRVDRAQRAHGRERRDEQREQAEGDHADAVAARQLRRVGDRAHRRFAHAQAVRHVPRRVRVFARRVAEDRDHQQRERQQRHEQPERERPGEHAAAGAAVALARADRGVERGDPRAQLVDPLGRRLALGARACDERPAAVGHPLPVSFHMGTLGACPPRPMQGRSASASCARGSVTSPACRGCSRRRSS